MPSAFRLATHEDAHLRVELLYPPAMFYALVHNQVPVVRHLSIENRDSTEKFDVDVSLELLGPDGPLADPWTRRIPDIAADGMIGWDEFTEFSPDPVALKSADEAYPVVYRATVRYAGGPPVVLSAESRVLAHNEWFNSPALYDSIAAFVQPNTDSVGQVLRAASDMLERQTGSGSLQGYQAGPRRAAQIGAALYAALRDLKITYVELPPSFEDTGQKIRTTGSVLRDRLGNCIDLSVTYAACVEAAGLHPLIWFIGGHAFAGFFLNDDRLPEIVSLDPAQMINVVEADKAVAVELTRIGPGAESAGFAEATRLARGQLRGPRPLLGMVDVHLAHRSGIRPMPSSAGLSPVPAATVEIALGQSFSLPAELEASGAFDQEENLATTATEDDTPPRVAAWQRALLDLSLRNPLLKLPKRGKGLDLHVPAGSLALLDDLVHSGKAINVVAQDVVSGTQELQGLRRAQDLPDEVIADELHRDRRLYGAVTQAAYVSRMRSLQRDARTLQQETGSNYLYLTLGSLVHPTPNGEAHAPLFLLPVRIEGGAGNRPYTVLIDGDELAAPNYCLVQWLRVKHGVQIGELDQPILDEHGIDIDASFRAIKKALLEANLGYRVDETASLRLLQFSTFQMWRDLTNHWRLLTRNQVVRHLVENSGKPMSGDDSPVEFDESLLHLPIATDGSQMRAVVMAAEGKSFVLEGPPGTGKSQTITNLIAHAARAGKTVLFVAEKQAALEVVKRRLATVGMAPFCLDLHGRKQNVRSIRAQLKDALDQASDADKHGWQALQAGYRSQIGTLQRYPLALHTENSAGFSAWSAYQARLAYPGYQVGQVPATFFALPQTQRDRVREVSRELPAAARSAQLRPSHPWMISGRRDVTSLAHDVVLAAAVELEELRHELGQYPEWLRSAIASLDHPLRLADAVQAAGLARAGVLPDLAHTLAAGQSGWDGQTAEAIRAVTAFRAEHSVVLSVFRPEFFVLATFDQLVVQADAAGRGLFGRKKRRIKLVEALRPHMLPSAELSENTVLDLVRSAAAARHAAQQVTGVVRSVPGLQLHPDWFPASPGAEPALRAAHEALLVSRSLHRNLPSLWQAVADLGRAVPGSFDRLPKAWADWLSVLASTSVEFTAWSADPGWSSAWHRDGSFWCSELRSGGLRPVQRWGTVLALTDVLAQAGLNGFRQQILAGDVQAEDIELAFLSGLAQSALTERLHAGNLEYFDANSHTRAVEEYLRLAEEIRGHLPEQLGSGLVQRRKAIDPRFDAKAGELIRRLNSRRDRLSFRDACREYSEIVTGLTPCFLMSPASVANFLEPGSMTFDILVFDEASQIRVAQAIGAMGRARSVVVVGDSKQMPPTSVMEAAHADESDNPVVPEDLDSILAECVESGLPRESLTWHYRSTDESLISFSNSHYYDNKLASLPSPGGDSDTGISWRRVDGRFDRGAKATRTNLIEAQAIVTEISRLLWAPRTQHRSIGVVTFNVQQRDHLLNLVEESTDERVQASLNREDGEALFVKNLENVQGDERDVILFSLAFSKNPETGQLPLNFGPLSWQGGERRLNVAITRARTQVLLFSSFDPSDIDLTRTNALGTRHLRAYLELAVGGFGRSGDVVSRRTDTRDRFADQVAAALRDRGHDVNVHFGLSHFTVDIAVRGQGARHWQVAVLLDGPDWAQRPTVADRDAAPQLLDKIMHWPSVVRIWLPQWLADQDLVLDHIDDLITRTTETHQQSVQRSAEQPPHPDHEPAQVRPQNPSPVGHLRAEAPVAAAPPLRPEVSQQADFQPYQPTRLGSPGDLNMLGRDRRVQEIVQDALYEVVEHEGPIEIDRLLRLVHKRFGVEKVHQDRKDLMARFIPKGVERTRFSGTQFLWPSGRDSGTWLGFRRGQGSADRAFNEIAPEEIANAIDQARRAGRARDQEELYRTTRELLGYGRMTEQMRSLIDRVVTWDSSTRTRAQ